MSAISPTQLTAKPASWTLACLTCPITPAHHYPLSLYVVLLANAATYALVGALVETIRQHYQTRSLSNRRSVAATMSGVALTYAVSMLFYYSSHNREETTCFEWYLELLSMQLGKRR